MKAYQRATEAAPSKDIQNETQERRAMPLT